MRSSDNINDFFADIGPNRVLSIPEAEAEGYDQAITSKRRAKKRDWAPGEYRPTGRRKYLNLPRELLEYEPEVGPRKKLEDL